MIKYLTDRELKRFMSEVSDRRKKDIFQTLLELGCRIGELCSLKVRWFDGVYVNVYDEKKDRFRHCVISDELAEELEDWYFDHRKIKRPGPAMFVYEDPRTIRRWMKDIGKRADIPKDKCHPHAFRHTYIVRAQSAGHNMKSICQQTGDTARTILEVYSEMSAEDRALQVREKPIFEGEPSDD